MSKKHKVAKLGPRVLARVDELRATNPKLSVNRALELLIEHRGRNPDDELLDSVLDLVDRHTAASGRLKNELWDFAYARRNAVEVSSRRSA